MFPFLRKSNHGKIETFWCVLAPLPYATLFQMQLNPNWGKHIVYLQKRKFFESMNKRPKKVIEIEANEFAIIGDQLYKRGKDQQLRLCPNEKESLPMLEQAYASLARVLFLAKTLAKAKKMSRIWRPTLFHDTHEYVKSCDKYQRVKTQYKWTTCHCTH